MASTRLRAASAPPRFRPPLAATPAHEARASRSLATLSGLLVGYDLGVTAGVFIMESFVYDYCVDWHNFMREDCKAPLSELPTHWTTYMARYAAVHYAGAFVGAVLSSRLAGRYGRRGTVFTSAMLYCIACGGAFYMPPRWHRLLLTVRAAQGLAMGLFSSTLSLLAKEIAPLSRQRSDLARVTRLSIAAGLLISSAANMAMERRIQGWRKTNAAASFITFGAMCAIYFVPPSPKWMLMKKGRDEAEKVLRRHRRTSNVSLELNSLVLEASKTSSSSILPRSPASLKTTIMTLVLHVLRQATGIGAVLTFGALIFKDVAHAGLPAMVLLAIAYLVGSVVGERFARMFGLRQLLLGGAISMSAAHCISAAISWAFCKSNAPADAQCSEAVGWLLSWTTAWFVFSFSASWGSAFGEQSFPSKDASADSLEQSMDVSTAATWFVSGAGTNVAMLVLPQMAMNDLFFVLAWLCGYAGLFVYVFCPDSSDCEALKKGKQGLTSLLEAKSQALCKVV